jgi:hypothetical protein
VQHAGVDVSIGDTVGELRSSWDRVGELIATGETAAAAERRVGEAAAQVHVVTSGTAVVPAAAAAL